MVAAQRGLVLSFRREKQAIPGFVSARSQDQHEPSVEIAALAAEHRPFDIGGLFCQGLGHPLERMRSVRFCF